jgi:hypothetical protein
MSKKTKITRKGRLSAKPSGSSRQQPSRSLTAFRARMPRLRKPSAVLVREMRDAERY